MLVKLWFICFFMMKSLVSSTQYYIGPHNNTGCHAGHFKCYDGECILSTEKCDGWDDCDDGSDELNCELESCEPPHFYKCANGACIPVKMVCNGEIDCPDGSDEVGCPYSTDLAENEQCNEKEYQCPNEVCIPKNLHCDGLADCLDGSDEDCHNGDVLMFFSLKDEIRGYFLHGEDLDEVFCSIVVNNSTHIVGVAYDGSYLFWSNIFKGQEEIVKARVDGNRETCLTAGVGEPEELAVDWMTDNVYFTDSKNKVIGVCDSYLNTCTCISNSDVDKPRGIALFPKEGFMYWSDWGKRPVIARSGMDGSEVTDFVSERVYWPNGITIDHGNERLYWADAKTSSIESIKLDGTDRRVVLDNTVEHPFSIAVFGDTLYWSDLEGKKIEAANKYTGRGRRTVFNENKRVFGISIYRRAMQLISIRITNPCAYARCSDLCLLAPSNTTGRWYTCACPEGKKLAYEHSCIEADTKQSGLKISQPDDKRLESHAIEKSPLQNDTLDAVEHDSVSGSAIGGNKRFELDRSVSSNKLPSAGVTGIDPGHSLPCRINNGNCSHVCLVSSTGHRVCMCPDGMLLHDELTCVAGTDLKRLGSEGESNGCCYWWLLLGLLFIAVHIAVLFYGVTSRSNRRCHYGIGRYEKCTNENCLSLRFVSSE